ncbi:MAG TPA: M48 family metallopeptidase [bacterium]|nr:M48 family metallopeptidase [bacterium]
MEPPVHLYDQIARNKRNSVLLMTSAVLLLAVLGFVFGAYYEAPISGMLVASGAATIYLLISWYAGSSLVMLSMGAREIEKREYPQLFNIVEEMAIASGLPMPKIYVIQSNASNAFATGMRPDKAAISVTTGIMETLNREELQAVVAHEMGHIKNFDSRFSVLMAVLVGVVALMCDAFWRMARGSRKSSSSSKGGGQAQLIIFIAAIVLAILAPLAAKLIQFSMSRRRELLADNTSAELTRNPGALANALEKIVKDPDPLDIANRGTQHLFIANPLKTLKDVKALQEKNEKSGWFDTHPPMALRVRLLREMSHQDGTDPSASRA